MRPAAKSGSRHSAWRKPRLVAVPAMWVWPSASRRRNSASARLAAWVVSLAIIGS